MRALVFLVMVSSTATAAEPTCEGHCGGKSEGGECLCDDGCEAWHDCCADKLTFCPPCKPACKGKQCGEDGCGGSCGDCGFGAPCVSGLCGCVPDCGQRACGPDGCGGTCGSCQDGLACSDNGACAAPPAVVETANDVGPSTPVAIDAGTPDGCSAGQRRGHLAAIVCMSLLLALMRRRLCAR